MEPRGGLGVQGGVHRQAVARHMHVLHGIWQTRLSGPSSACYFDHVDTGTQDVGFTACNVTDVSYGAGLRTVGDIALQVGGGQAARLRYEPLQVHVQRRKGQAIALPPLWAARRGCRRAACTALAVAQAVQRIASCLAYILTSGVCAQPSPAPLGPRGQIDGGSFADGAAHQSYGGGLAAEMVLRPLKVTNTAFVNNLANGGASAPQLLLQYSSAKACCQRAACHAQQAHA